MQYIYIYIHTDIRKTCGHGALPPPPSPCWLCLVLNVVSTVACSAACGMATVKGTPIELKVVVPGLPEALQGTTYVYLPAKLTLVTGSHALASARARALGARATATATDDHEPSASATATGSHTGASATVTATAACMEPQPVPKRQKTQDDHEKAASQEDDYCEIIDNSPRPFDTPVLPDELQQGAGASLSAVGASDSLPVDALHRERMRALMTDMAGGDTLPEESQRP